jgi:hypothetical protein
VTAAACFTASLAALAALLLAAALPLSPPARLVPLAMLAPTLLALVVQLALDLRAGRGHAAAAPGQARREWQAGLLLLALVAATDLLGLVPAVALLTLAAGWRAGLPAPRAAAIAAIILVTLGLGLGALGVRLPSARVATLVPA